MKHHPVRVLIVAIGVIIGVRGTTTLLAQPASANPQEIVSSRPIATLRALLQKRYGKIITYEDPVWAWEGELQPMGQSAVLLVPKTLTLVVPGEASSENDVRTALDRGLDVYNHQQTDGPRFQILSSRLGLHIVPTQVHGASGRLEPARNPLDAEIFVPSGDRTADEHILAINSAITTATGVPLLKGILNGALGSQFAADPPSFIWGVSNMTARAALLDLFDRSATSFSWSLLCQAAKQPKDRICALNISAMVVSIIGDDGKADERPVLWDRCGKCPPLR